jgi:hypothetical protein
MSLDTTRLGDQMMAVGGYQRPAQGSSLVRGHGTVEVHGPDGELKQSLSFVNQITDVGEQLYGERGAGITTTAIPTGMQLGTGTTGTAKNGAGAAIVTLVPSSLVALTGGYPQSSKPGTVRRIVYQVLWAAGTATANAISEVALVNQGTGTQTAAPAANTISRALLSPTVNKGSADTLTITWNHDIGS